MKHAGLVVAIISLLMVAVAAPAVQLQVGAFSEPANLQSRIDQLDKLDITVHQLETAGELTRLRTGDLTRDRLASIKQTLNRHDIDYAIVGREPEPDYRKAGKDALPDLPAGLPPISGYQRTLSDTLVQRLKSIMGTEYVWGAESPSNGFDCSGLLYWLFKRETPRTVATMWPWTQPIDRNQLEPGDFVYFTFDSYEEPDHIGLYLGGGEFVHASSTYGVIKADLSKNYYQRNLYGFGRPPF